MIDVQYTVYDVVSKLYYTRAIRFNIPDGCNIYCSRAENRKMASAKNYNIVFFPPSRTSKRIAM